MKLHILAVSAVLFAGATQAHAQVSADSTCYYTNKPGRTLTFSIPGNLRVELTRLSDSVDTEYVCRATIRNARGAVLWTQDGFGAALNAWTGQDIDGDGTPDGVLTVDSGGGNACCWNYFLFQLTPRFRLIRELDYVAQFQHDERGRTIIYEFPAFNSLGYSHAETPYVALAHQFRAGKLEDITLERCAHILTDTAPTLITRQWDWDFATPAMRAASKQARSVTDSVSQTRHAVTGIALQYFACKRDGDAERIVRETWPEADAAKMLATLREAWRKMQ